MENSIVNIVLIFVGLLLAIFVHEFGHFLIAKLSGVRIFEFSVGLGPKIVKKQTSSTLYALRLIPLGGYVLVASKLLVKELQKTGDPLYNDVKENDYLESKPPWIRIAFFFGGITTNFIFSLFLALFIDYLVYGRFVFDILVEGAFKSIKVLFEEIFTGSIFKPKESQVTGIIASTATAAQNEEFISWYYFYYLGLSLVAFNLLPIPPLDGYKVLETIFVEYIYKKELKTKTRTTINIVGAIFLAVLFLIIIIADALKIS